MRINIKPMGAVRMTQKGKYMDPNALRYLNYKQEIAYKMRQTVSAAKLGPIAVKVTFHMLIPESWTHKRRHALVGQHCAKKPDIDNLIKGVFDAANGILWKDDNQVVMVESQKRYALIPGIEIEVEELSNENAA
ncbi:RusA family crossover junction endodeoxyribonuclease [Paenibacillus taiwanensis]|uniref:RusA family crossover junction endodeoxyribonuclease n=1 Tax=Paenibacillus taiwanensis TaxID=401638 RepID=UPI000490F0E2|nr:RusA family crossover junction endodeoxyribonuclease [Paenibacillus taiwanensis]